MFVSVLNTVLDVTLLFVFARAPRSSFTGHRAATGEPPQSAQDKARMDKEYLSLMAELGEAPISSSGGGGGHSGSQGGGGGPRSSGHSNNQQPPVCTPPTN